MSAPERHAIGAGARDRAVDGARHAVRDRRWERRARRARSTIERDASLQVSSARRGPALTTPVAANGRTDVLRAIAPGEPVEHEGAYAIGALVGSLVTRAAWIPRPDDARRVVLVQRQRGPWRGFDTIHIASIHNESFVDAADATSHHDRVRDAIERGGPLPAPPTPPP